MKQRYLPLTAESLANPRAHHLDEIIAVMTWPDDDEKRIRSGRSSRAKFSATTLLSHLTESEKSHLIDFTINAAPLEQIQQEVNPLLVHGVRSGLYLHAALFGTDAGMKNERYKISSFTIPKHSREIAEKTFENDYWPKYRPVCHLWAATIDFMIANDDGAFPCRDHQLVNFIGLSEGYRLLGERTKQARTRHLVLPPGEAIAINPALNVKPLFPIMEENPPASTSDSPGM